MLDPYSYVAPSRVKTFLCPAGQIKRNVFLQYAERLDSANEVRLLDVTPDPRPDRGMFSPQGFPHGKVIYDLSLAPIDEQLCSLYDLEPWRQTMMVLALTSYKDNMEMDFEKEVKDLRKQFPGQICHKVLVFGVPDEDTIKQTKCVIPVLSSKVSNVTSLETVMSDITADFLAELGVLYITKKLGSFISPGIKELDTPKAVARPGDKPYNVSLRRGVVNHSNSSINLAAAARHASVSKTGSISIGPTERTKSKQHGRVLKYTGNLFLMAGRVPDALKNFTDAATMLKSAHDHLWFASALDSIGVCLVLQSFLEVPTSIPQVVLQTTSAYHESTPSTPGRNTPDNNSSTASTPSSATTTVHVSTAPDLIDYLPELTGTVVRFYARSQSSSEESVPQLVYCETMLRFAKLLVMTRLGGGLTGAALSAVVRGTSVGKHITKGSTSTTQVAYWCNKLYSTDLSNLPILAQCNIYSGIASAYSSIGLYRKRTFILRELLINLIPKILKSRQQRQQFEEERQMPESGFLTLLDGIQERGILELLDMLCQVYGAGDITALGCGWIDLKVSFLRTCIAVCDSIPDMEGVVYYTSLLLSTSADVLSNDEQQRHYQKILASLDKSRQLGRGDIVAKYWDPCLLRDVRVAAASSSTPIEQMPQGEDSAGVFLYNPYKKPSQEEAESASQRVLVQNERVDFMIKLQNPFAFEVQVSELTMLTEGVEVVASATNVYLPPTAMYELVLPVVPKTTGQLKIIGCRVQMAGCAAVDYYLKDRFKEPEDKVKEIGFNSGKRVKQAIQDNEHRRQLELKVVPSQPMMAVKSMDLNRGWMMLLEGENHQFMLTLSNISDVCVNLVQFKFSDSTTEPLQQAMTSKELALNEVYECEYFLYNRRALVWENTKDGMIVQPHQTGSFRIRVNGKRGMTNALINVDYSNEDKQSSSVWTRRLSVPVNVTVNSSIELGGCDVIPLQACQAFKNNNDDAPLAQFMRTLSKDTLLSDYCVFVADMRNSWTQPMQVTVWSKTGDNQTLVKMTETIYPNRIKRFLLPIKWKPLPIDQVDQPIPLKSRRQYVVDNNREQARFMREAFWNREKLLGMIGGEWVTQDSPSRSGMVELRGLRLTQKMVNVLRLEQVQMSMKMEKSQFVNEVTCQVDCDEATTLATTVSNKSSEPISGMLRIVPSVRYDHDNDEINRKVLYNGVLQRPVFDVAPGASVDVKLGMVFVARGEYEWTSIFETSNQGPQRLQQHGQRQPMYVKVV